MLLLLFATPSSEPNLTPVAVAVDVSDAAPTLPVLPTLQPRWFLASSLLSAVRSTLAHPSSRHLVSTWKDAGCTLRISTLVESSVSASARHERAAWCLR